MKRTFVIICTLLASAACERNDRQEETSPSLLPPPAVDPGTPRTEPSRLEPGINAPATAAEERLNMSGKDKDEPAAGMEHGSPSQSASDRAISARVREAVTEEESLSGSAKNLSIDTSEGIVTLRGPVQSATEKARVSELVNRVDGVKRVDNQLVIAGD